MKLNRFLSSKGEVMKDLKKIAMWNLVPLNSTCNLFEVGMIGRSGGVSPDLVTEDSLLLLLTGAITCTKCFIVWGTAV